ncbi:hypothetical protein D9M71_709910 [compost metagenome]
MLIDDGQDGSGNQIPFLVETEREHRLDISDALIALTAGAEFLVPVVLNRQTV